MRMALPFISLTRGESSLYLGAHDPEVWPKTYKVKPGEYCYLGTYVENMAEPDRLPGAFPRFIRRLSRRLAACV